MTKLKLRKATMDDLQDFYQWESNPELKTFFSIDDNLTYEDVENDFVERINNDSVREFVIETEEGKKLGRIYISRYNKHESSLDITRIYIGSVDERGKGYGEAALMLALDYAFEELKVHRVTLDHFTGNEVAANLYLKLGFKYEGVARDGALKNGKYYDLHLMSILEDEYRTLKNRDAKSQ